MIREKLVPVTQPADRLTYPLTPMLAGFTRILGNKNVLFPSFPDNSSSKLKNDLFKKITQLESQTLTRNHSKQSFEFFLWRTILTGFMFWAFFYELMRFKQVCLLSDRTTFKHSCHKFQRIRKSVNCDDNLGVKIFTQLQILVTKCS